MKYVACETGSSFCEDVDMKQTDLASSEEKSCNLDRPDSRVFASLTLMVFLMTASLWLMGQPFWCKCGQWSVTSWDIWSLHNSQHIVDPYSFTHILHGVVLGGVFFFLPGSMSPWKKFLAAILLECCWEILENSAPVIERYRAATISKDYFGDSIANSASDVLACAIGYLLAARLRVIGAVAFFVVTEVVLLLTIRDSLILNVLMLVFPMDAVRQWQTG